MPGHLEHVVDGVARGGRLGDLLGLGFLGGRGYRALEVHGLRLRIGVHVDVGRIDRAASRPSDTDLQGMAPENVYIILSVNDRLRVVPWSYNDDGSLSGTTDDHYFRLTAYIVGASGEHRRTPILCPYALGFGTTRRLRAIK